MFGDFDRHEIGGSDLLADPGAPGVADDGGDLFAPALVAIDTSDTIAFAPDAPLLLDHDALLPPEAALIAIDVGGIGAEAAMETVETVAEPDATGGQGSHEAGTVTEQVAPADALAPEDGLSGLWSVDWDPAMPSDVVAPVNDWTPDQFDGVGDPRVDAAHWHAQQGENSCAVVAQMSIYESITGQPVSEEAFCRFAEEQGWYTASGDYAGTLPQDTGKVLTALGIPTERHYDATLVDLADALERGDKVIVGLDASEITVPLRDAATGMPIEQHNAGHAVWVTGIDTQPDGSVKIILNDSGHAGGRMVAVDAPDFLNAWEDYGNFVTVAHPPARVDDPALLVGATGGATMATAAPERLGAGTCSHCGGNGYTTWPSSGTREACWYCGGSGVAH